MRDPYCDTGKTCFGGGMHCPSVSSYYYYYYYYYYYIINNELIIVMPNIKNVVWSLYKVTCIWVFS